MSTAHTASARSARLVFASAAGLLLYTLWAWAGTRPSWHRGGVVLAAGLFVALLGFGGVRALARDPVCGLGVAFLLLLAAAWANAGRTLYFDVVARAWQYTPPAWPAAPAAFVRAEAAEMLGWFFPAWVLALALRSPALDRAAMLRLLRLFAGASGLLALFGLAQYLIGARGIYGGAPLSGHFFATFAYPNHAAAFFLLAAAVSAGLLLHEFVRWGRPRLTTTALGAGLSALACLAGACLSLSRAGLLLALLLALGWLGYSVWLAGRLFEPADRLRFLAGLALLVVLAAGAVLALGGRAIRREFTAAAPGAGGSRLNLSLSGRPIFLRAAWAMWQDHRWWGVGGHGFKYTVARYLPAAQQAELQRAGWANVHCDPLQWLVEFGLVGALLLSALAGVLLRPLARLRRGWYEPLPLLGACGLGALLVFSLIDLPLRCPALLYSGLLVLVALPRLGSAPATPPPRSHAYA